MAATKETVIRVDPIKHETIELRVLGTMPLILNSMAEKAYHELLLPGRRKTAADKAASLKHDPLAEFRGAALTVPEGPTLLGLLSTAFKGAMMTAALDMPGATKAQIGRLVWVEGVHVGLYGVPRLFMSIVRSADINKTPDVRTRPILPRWAAIVRVSYVVPLINQQSVVNLMSAAGVTAGVGDWRPQKGKGTYGQFSLVGPDDAEFLSVLTEGREAQKAAMAAPESYDAETAELLEWYASETDRRGRLSVA